MNSDASGMNRYLFSHLQKRGWRLDIANIPFPRSLRCLSLVLSFRPNMQQWKKKFAKTSICYYKSPLSFIKRTRHCQSILSKRNGKKEIIFQVSSMFAPSLNGTDKPYVLFVDWTRELSNREYAAWAPVTNTHKKKQWYELEKNLYSNAAHIFTPSEYTKRSFIKDYGIAKKKVTVTGYGPTLEKLPTSNFKKSYDGKTILFVGYEFERKGGFVLLSAFKKVRQTIKDARLIIVGPSYLDEKIEGVELKGPLKDKNELEALYQQASIFVMPSLCEPFGLVFLEAMSYKLPCICTAIDAMPEIIKDGETGFVVTAADAKATAERISHLLKNRDLMQKMGEAGRKKIRDYFNWDSVLDRIDNVLCNLVNK